MDDKKLVSGEPEISGRQRVGADHRPVDRQRQPGQAETPREPGGPDSEANDNRALDPYHRDEPGEDSPQGSASRPKAPPVHQADEQGHLFEPRRKG